MPRTTLHVLESYELVDMASILAQAQRVTGVKVKPTYIGTLVGSQDVLSGQAGTHYDAIWLASDNYIALSPGGLTRLDATNQIMASPVILGLRTSVAGRLGWIGRPVSWADIVAAAAAHKFTFGMTDPALSNAGFCALASVATALAGQGAALQASQIPAVMSKLRELFGAQMLTRQSSGSLVRAYINGQTGTSAVDGLIDYESVLLSLNASGKLHQRLTMIYPSDGVITASYPFSLLSSASGTAKDAYLRLVSYLLSPPVQDKIIRLARRRPATPGVTSDPNLRKHPIYELPFPGTMEVVRTLQAAYRAARA